jgi:hypothetical protein
VIEKQRYIMSKPLDQMTDDDLASFLTEDGLFDYWERKIAMPVICNNIAQELYSNKVATTIIRVA